jgi:hypothetical protein
MFGMQKTRRMLYTGEPISAQEAYRLGGIEAVVKRSELRAAARELAAKIATKSPKAMRLAKWSLNGIELLDPKKSYRFEQGFTFELYTSPDSQEARDAFVEKRAARSSMTGRSAEAARAITSPECRLRRARDAPASSRAARSRADSTSSANGHASGTARSSTKSATAIRNSSGKRSRARRATNQPTSAERGMRIAPR